jgi:hypothetical protein
MLRKDMDGFVDVDLCGKCFAISESFPLLSLEKIIKMRAEKAGKESFDGAAAAYDNLPVKKWKKQGSVKAQTRTGLRMEVTFWFLTEGEFQTKYELSARSMGLKITKILDEEASRMLKGVLVTPRPNDPPYAYRRVILWSEKLRMLSSHSLTTGHQLREEHPQELFDIEVVEDVKTRSEECSAPQLCLVIRIYSRLVGRGFSQRVRSKLALRLRFLDVRTRLCVAADNLILVP